MGTENLCNIYGMERIRSIVNILDQDITEERIYNLLKNKYGTTILGYKNLRIKIFSVLPNEYLNYLINEKFIKKNINETDLIKLKKTKWSNSSNVIKRLIQIFNLSDDYLPFTSIKKPDMEIIRPQNILFSHQKRIKDQIIKYIQQKEMKFIVNMPTGAGKTRTAMEGLVDFWRTLSNKKKFIVWFAKSDELCEQAFNTLSEIWKIRGESDLKIFRLWGSYNPKIHDNESGFVICSFTKIYSLMGTRHNDIFHQIVNIRRNCKLIIVDEAHQSIADTYSKAIKFVSNLDKAYLIGLTATPGRSWNVSENQKLADYYNNKIIEITDDRDLPIKDPVMFLQKNNFLSYVKTDPIKTNITFELTNDEKKYLHEKLELPESFLKKIAENEERNLAILLHLKKYYSKNKSIIVFALSLDHAGLLNDLSNIVGMKSASIDKDTEMTNRRKFIKQFKNKEINILFNYGVLTTGFDAPNTNVIFIARHTNSPVLYNQMIGRGIRGTRVGGNKECIIVDVEDNIIGMPNERSSFTMFRDNFNIN